METSEPADGHRKSSKSFPTCGAKKRQGEGYCDRPAGWGTDHVGAGACRTHGGSTPTQVKAARKVLAAQELRRLGMPTQGDVDAQHELLSMVAEASGNVRTLRTWVQDMAEDELYVETFGPSGRATGHSEEHVKVVMYREWCDRLVSYSSSAIRAGISERAVKIMEAQAELFAQVLMSLLDDPEFGLSWEQRELGRRIAGRHLRALPVGA